MSDDAHYISESRRDRERLNGPMPSERELTGFLLGENSVEVDDFVLRQIEGRDYLREEFYQLQQSLLPENGSGPDVLSALKTLLEARLRGPQALTELARNDLQPRWLRTRARARLPRNARAEDSPEASIRLSQGASLAEPPVWLERALGKLAAEEGFSPPSFTSWSQALEASSTAMRDLDAPLDLVRERLDRQITDVFSDGDYSLTQATSTRGGKGGRLSLPRISLDKMATENVYRARLVLSLPHAVQSAALAIRLRKPGELWLYLSLASEPGQSNVWVAEIPTDLRKLLALYATQALYALVELSV